MIMKKKVLQQNLSEVIRGIERAIRNKDVIRKSKPQQRVNPRPTPKKRIKLRTNKIYNDKEGNITLAELCQQLGINPTNARRILRKHPDCKPKGQGSWKWNLKSDEDLIAQVKEYLK